VGDGELKTKPTQHSVKAMQEQGIQPDILICRAPVMLDDATRSKLALFANIENDAVLTSYNVSATIYEIPLIFFDQKLDQVVLKKLGLEARHANIAPWKKVIEQVASRQGKVRVGIVGKYMDLHEAYQSVYEALFHAALACGVDVDLVKIDASWLEEAESIDLILGKESPGGMLDGVLIPGGFGHWGIKGMIKAAEWARVNRVPFLGICLGMHIMTIEWARNVLGWEEADSTEFSRDTKKPVVSLLGEQADVKNYGDTMRLGKYVSITQPGTKIAAAYGADSITERYRHRYVFSTRYREEMLNAGLVVGSLCPDKNLVECIEWKDHPWGVSVQFHPEFKSKPTQASPLFRDFVAAARDLKARAD
jgi:CTP synthase